MDLSLNSAGMKYYKQNCVLNYFEDPVPNGTVIYMDDVPFQYKERQDKYTEFLGNPTSMIFVADKRHHELLLNQISNASNMSNNSNNSRRLNFTEKSNNLIHLSPANPGYTSHTIYNT